ncbi:nucleoside monophosphate kinase [Candidatus Microgenomates bacterium]|nr:nucleoside monophosphate kinase [Candidatus Microgenomates bacterium]
MKDTSEQSRRRCIIVMGPVGSGKSTQAELLAKHFNVPHVEMGALLRGLSNTSQDVRELVDAGKLVPDSLTLELLGKELEKNQYKNGFVVDGVPRTLFQAHHLPFTPDVVIYLRVRDSENVKRLILRRRADDTEEVVKERLSIYHEQTAPVLHFYRTQGKLVEVDGEPPIEVIFQDILRKLQN